MPMVSPTLTATRTTAWTAEYVDTGASGAEAGYSPKDNQIIAKTGRPNDCRNSTVLPLYLFHKRRRNCEGRICVSSTEEPSDARSRHEHIVATRVCVGVCLLSLAMSTGTWNTLRNWCSMSPSARSSNRAKLAATATQSVNDLPAACADSVGFVPWWRRLHLVAADASTLSLGFCASTVTNPTSADQLAFGLASARRRNEAGRLAAQHPPERALDALRASRPYRSRRTAARGPRIPVPLGACHTEQARRRFLHACRAHRQRRFRLRAPCPHRVARALEQVTGTRNSGFLLP